MSRMGIEHVPISQDHPTESSPEDIVLHDERVRVWRDRIERLKTVKNERQRAAGRRVEHINKDVDRQMRDGEIVFEGVLDGKTLKEIGEDIARLNRPEGTPPLSRERVRQIYFRLGRELSAILGEDSLRMDIRELEKMLKV